MLEVAVYGVASTVLWMSSATFLLPFLILLRYNKTLRDMWFSFLFMKVLKPFFEPKLLPFRKQAFELLKNELSERDTSKPLKLLEIGIGGGGNLLFYPENSHLTALDMNPNFETFFRQNQKKYPQVVYERLVTAFAEDMKGVDDSSMDVVVSTYVLCSVTSVKDVLREVKRVLKPGGKFLFLEHVSHSKSEWAYTLQQYTEPLWKIYFDGCCLGRAIDEDIKNAGFSDVTCEKILSPSLLLYVRAQVYGVATK